MNHEINNDSRHQIAMLLNDPDQIALLIIQVIRTQLDAWAPLRRIQTRNKTLNLSPNSKVIKTNRDAAWKTYCQVPSLDNLRQYKHLKSQF